MIVSFETLLGDLRPEVVFLDNVLEKFCSMKENQDLYDKGEFGEGATPYALRSMLSIIMYGRWIRVTSLRGLEFMAGTNLECMYLSGNARPSHTALGLFMKDYKTIIDRFFSYTVQVASDNNLVGGRNVCIDGSKLGAWASNTHGRAMEDKIKKLIGKKSQLESYLKELEQNELDEQSREALMKEGQEALSSCQTAVSELEEALQSMKDDGTYRACVNDTDARRMVEGNTKASRAAPNIQAAVDDRTNIVVAVDVTSDYNDIHQLQPMTEKAREILAANGIVLQEVTTDQGYGEIKQIEKLESQGIQCNVDLNEPTNKSYLWKNVSIVYSDTDPSEAPTVTCPAGHVMSHSEKPHPSRSQEVWAYRNSLPLCRNCPLMPKCHNGGPVKKLVIRINVLQQRIDRHNENMRHPERRSRVEQRKGHGEALFGYMKISREHRPLMRTGRDKVRIDVCSTFAALNLKHIFNHFQGMVERITVHVPKRNALGILAPVA